jgi:uncharacterized membrane protein SpoIIM required for sporulation
MKETRFIAQNKEKWEESEALLSAQAKDPEKLSNLFTQVVDDLSYSRTYYPNRSVRVYLNKIAREFFSIIYSHQKEKKNPIKLFWMNELPQIVYFSRKPLLIALCVFLLSTAIGIFSASNDPNFTATILGDDYVAMTKENIENGDPMAVYKKGHQVDMVLGITLNNLRVAFQTYVFGIFLSIGTLAILLYNGIMVGCFQFFFVERGLLAESALTIWLHGTLEISAIIIAGGAGLTLGSGLIFPGSYSRLQAFQISAMRSLKLMLGISPIIVLAAIIESFLTRYTDVPDILRLFLIILSAVFIIGYFVVYPWLKAKRGWDEPLREAKLPPTIDEPIAYDKIKNNGEIIKDAFLFYKRNATPLLSWIVPITFLMALAEFFSPDPRTPVRDFEIWFESFAGNLYYALKTYHPIYIAINAIGMSVVIYRALMLIHRDAGKNILKGFQLFTFVQIMLVTTVIFVVIFFFGGWGYLLIGASFVFFLMWSFIILHERSNLFSGFSLAGKSLLEAFASFMGLELILLLMSFSFLAILNAPILYFNTEILQWNFAKTDVWSQNLLKFIDIFLRTFAFNLVLPLMAASAAVNYFSLKEISTAEHLKKSIALIGIKTKRS